MHRYAEGQALRRNTNQTADANMLCEYCVCLSFVLKTCKTELTIH